MGQQATVLPEGVTVRIGEFFDPTMMDEPRLRIEASTDVGTGGDRQKLRVNCDADREFSLEAVGYAAAKTARKLVEAVAKYEAMTEAERAALAGGGEVG